MAKRGRGRKSKWVFNPRSVTQRTKWGRRYWVSMRGAKGKYWKFGERRTWKLMGERLAEPGRIAERAGRGPAGEMILPSGMTTVWQGQIIVDPGDFARKIRRLVMRLGPTRATQIVADLAWAMITKMRKAPIPRDTGFLSRSGNVEAIPAEQTVVFGFNTPYALEMDIGRDGLPPKPYGHDVGPNLYFSETLKQNVSWLYKEIVRKLEAAARAAH